jgi:hypothetical protein
MDTSSIIFLVLLFTPGLIRGAFWWDSPSIIGVFFTIFVIILVVVVGQITAWIAGEGIVPTVTMCLTILIVNALTLAKSEFFSSSSENHSQIDRKSDS